MVFLSIIRRGKWDKIPYFIFIVIASRPIAVRNCLIEVASSSEIVDD
jgi:hypothetical protein